MLKRDITYESPFTEEKVTETHYFHISKTDLVEMELEEHGETYTNKAGEELTGMQAKLQRVGESNDGKVIMATFKDIIKRAYGKKDGERFLKSQEIAEDFAASEAFSQLLFEMCTDPGAAADFVNHVIPGNMEEIAAEIQERAEKIAAGRAAQERAKAAAGTPAESPAIEAVERIAGATGVEFPNRETEIRDATSENPVVLTSVEVNEMESSQLKAGIADGRYKFS